MMKKTLTPESTIVQSKTQVSCEVAGETVILNHERGFYYSLDAVGARIWAWMQKPVGIEKLIARVLNEYDVESAQCERDLLRLLNELLTEGLIENGP